ncbi:MAG: type IX secretion system PorP/SprF family membrane protein [Saprospiraceae bacterium]|jgi:type IX secretion system PorP/SprF family membrane protein
MKYLQKIQLALLSNNEKLTSRFGKDYVNQNEHRESGLYNCFHERNRKIIFCVILIVALTINFGISQDVHFSNLQAFPLVLNPALTGFIPGAGNIRLSGATRHQWPSILNSASYQTTGFAVDMRNCLPSTKNNGKEIKGPTWGIGMSYIHDESGVLSVGDISEDRYSFQRDYINLTGSAIVPINKEIFFNAGFRVGGQFHRLKTGDLRYDEQFDGVSGFDPMATGEFEGMGQITSPQYDFGIGLAGFYFGKKWGISGGAALDHAFKKVKYDFGDFEDGPSLSRKITLHGKLTFVFPHNPKKDFRFGVVVKPLLLIIQEPYQQWVPGLDFFFQTKYDFTITAGSALRRTRHVTKGQHNDAILLNLSAAFNSFTVGFVYDVNVSSLEESTKRYGSLEFSLIYHWKRGNKCTPMNIGCPEDLVHTHPLFF